MFYCAGPSDGSCTKRKEIQTGNRPGNSPGDRPGKQTETQTRRQTRKTDRMIDRDYRNCPERAG
jgi:hypothetical protein